MPTLREQWLEISAHDNLKQTVRRQLNQFCHELRMQRQPLAWLDARKENVFWDPEKKKIIVFDFEYMEFLTDCSTPSGFECAEIMDELHCDPEAYGRGPCGDNVV